MSQLAVQLDGKTYVWSAVMDEAKVMEHAAHGKAIHLLFILEVVEACVFATLAVLFLLFTDVTRMFTSTFWFEPSWTSVFTYGALLALLFVWYHRRLTTHRDIGMPSIEGVISQVEEVEKVDKVVNIETLLSPDATRAVEAAFELANSYGHATVDPLHLFVGALDDANVHVVFNRLGLTLDALKNPVTRRLSTRVLGKPTQFSPEAQRVILEAFREALAEKRDSVSALELFAASYQAEPFLQELLLDERVDEHQFWNMVAWLRIHEKMRERYERFKKAALYKPTGAMNRSMTSVVTPMLDAVSEDLTTAAVSGRLPMLIEREDAIEELFRVIEGGRQSVVLVGPVGVGKTSILAGVAELMVEERVPKILQDRRLVRISIPHLVSGATEAQVQERLLLVLSEVAKSRNIILAITDIDQLVSSSGANDLASTLVDFLSRSGTFAVATTTPQAYSEVVERSVLGRAFQKVDILEPDHASAIHMLESKIGGMEYEHNVVFSYEAVEKAVTLTDRYMHETYLPKKAIEVASETALQVSKTKGKDALVTGEDVSAIVAGKTGIPTTAVASDETEKLLTLESRMHGRVIGQDEAVSAVSAALRRARTELRSQTRPIATFLFLGPTGVGKTELAKTVAQTYFGSEDMMIRLDMSEYQDASSIHRMIGIPGSGQGGLLTEAVRKNPFSIVLLDELEKAEPDILNVFLQVFDDGRLTDALGRTIDFTNTIIIATSNAGTQEIQDAVGRGEELATIKTRLLEETLRGIYRPEFLNRFDGVILFKPLSQADVLSITELFMQQVSQRLEPKGIGFRAQPEAIAELAQKGFDPKFGARPLRRLVQEEVDNAIANALLQGNVKRRDTIVLQPGGSIRIEEAHAL
ncbi:ATP-dependent Clp protease ATP-binding subunit [Candidatus Uhrbacteria bacterium]|nr:ATP-dependent Clp protease ATP-binding subunit [Candidatus Uhrbacteria bacterium]